MLGVKLSFKKERDMSRLTAFWKSGIVGKGVIILAAFVVLCCAPLTIVGIVAPKPAATAVPAVAVAAPAATKAPEVTVAATETSVPTVEATATVAPSETAVPATETAAPPALAKVGDRAESGGIALTVVMVERKAAMNDFMKAKDGNTYLIAEVVIESIDRDKAPYNPFYFKVKDSDGREYTMTINIADDSLKSGDLAKGEKVRGTVAFEVKKEAAGLVMSYEPIVIFGGYSPIKVALE
jgi:hypothetical protein